MNYIDDMYEEMLRRTGAAPKRSMAGQFAMPSDELSSEMPGSYIKNSLAGSSQDNPQVQPEVTIVPENRPIIAPTFKEPEKQKPEYIQNYLENINPMIEARTGNIQDMLGEREDLKSRENLSRNALISSIKGLAEATPEFKPSYDYAGKIKELSSIQDLSQNDDVKPKENIISEIIKSFGAPVLGAMSGESGAIAQLGAQKSIRDMYEKQQKLDTEREKIRENKKLKLSDEVSKRMVGLEKLQSGEFAIHKDQIKDRRERLEKLSDRVAKLNEGDQKGLHDALSELNKYDNETFKEASGGAKEYAKMQEHVLGQQGLDKRAEEANKVKLQIAKMPKKSAASEQDPDSIVLGYKWNQKTPLSKPDIPKLQQAVSDKDSLVNLLKSVKEKVSAARDIDLINPYSEASKSIKSDLRDAQLLYKGPSFAQLGVLNGKDLQVLEDVIEAPNLTNVLTQGGKSALAGRYDKAIERVNNRVEDHLRMRGFNKKGVESKMTYEQKLELAKKRGLIK